MKELYDKFLAAGGDEQIKKIEAASSEQIALLQRNADKIKSECRTAAEGSAARKIDELTTQATDKINVATKRAEEAKQEFIDMITFMRQELQQEADAMRNKIIAVAVGVCLIVNVFFLILK